MYMKTGQRVTVINDAYGRYIDQTGTVVECPPEFAGREFDTPDITWVRLDDMDARVPAVGFRAGALLADAK